MDRAFKQPPIQEITNYGLGFQVALECWLAVRFATQFAFKFFLSGAVDPAR
jgi:hypothetical protein